MAILFPVTTVTVNGSAQAAVKHLNTSKIHSIDPHSDGAIILYESPSDLTGGKYKMTVSDTPAEIEALANAALLAAE